MRTTISALLIGIICAALVAAPVEAGWWTRVGRTAVRGLANGATKKAARSAGRVAGSKAQSTGARSLAVPAAHAGLPLAWVNRGVRSVLVKQLPHAGPGVRIPPTGKVTPGELRNGLRELERMRPTIEKGTGASSAYWREVDRRAGKTYANGRQRIYDSYYGSRAIRVEKFGDRYVVTNGHHRIQAAREMGLNDLPVRVVESVPRAGVP